MGFDFLREAADELTAVSGGGPIQQLQDLAGVLEELLAAPTATDQWAALEKLKALERRAGG